MKFIRSQRISNDDKEVAEFQKKNFNLKFNRLQRILDDGCKDGRDKDREDGANLGTKDQILINKCINNDNDDDDDNDNNNLGIKYLSLYQ